MRKNKYLTCPEQRPEMPDMSVFDGICTCRLVENDAHNIGYPGCNREVGIREERSKESGGNEKM